jgi:hypothetical protein
MLLLFFPYSPLYSLSSLYVRTQKPCFCISVLFFQNVGHLTRVYRSLTKSKYINHWWLPIGRNAFDLSGIYYLFKISNFKCFKKLVACSHYTWALCLFLITWSLLEVRNTDAQQVCLPAVYVFMYWSIRFSARECRRRPKTWQVMHHTSSVTSSVSADRLHSSPWHLC